MAQVNESEHAAAEEFFGLLIQTLRDSRGEVTGTTIVTAVGVAGAQLFRGTGINTGDLQPGSYVLIDILNDQGMELLDLIDSIGQELANESIAGWDLPELAGTGPDKSIFDLIGEYEVPFVEICDRNSVEVGRRPQIAATVIALILHRASPVLSWDVGKSIAAQALVHACKHVPPPLQA